MKPAPLSGILTIIILVSNGILCAQEFVVTDVDGHKYNTIKIGTQTWMSENLQTTKFNDGTPIPLVNDLAEWAALSSPAFCWYDNDEGNKYIYGALYNGYSINSGKLCPTGWHVSSDKDWLELTEFLGGEPVAGGKLKESGPEHWSEPNSGADNESKFTALPGGSRYSNGIFMTIKNLGYWWSPQEKNTFNNWYRSMYYRDTSVSRNYFDSTNGLSVRCVKN